MIVLDTCALYWWTVRPQLLSRRALAACQKIDAHGAVVCTVSFWELGMKAKAGRLELGCSIREYAQRAARITGLEMVAADADLWVDSLELDWAHRDPADRLIVGLAKRRQLAIVTADEVIRQWYPRVIW